MLLNRRSLIAPHVSFGMLPKTWVFLRGLARESGHWGEFPSYFADQLSNFVSSKDQIQVTCIDLPGIGTFSDVESPLSMAEIAKMARTEARKVLPNERVAIFAISLGGMVAMDWMRQFPDEIEAAVLVNSSAKQSPFYNRLRYQIWPEFINILATANIRDRERKLVHLLINDASAREKALAKWARVSTEHPIRVRTFLRQLYAASQFKGLKTVPKIPVLLLNSLGDRLVDPSCSEVLHHKYKWKLERHPWGGHDLIWDAPEWVTQSIARFFS